MMWRAGHRKFLRNERGAATIEFVCTLPLFLAALAFAFEFGQIFLAHQSTVNNVRAASRYLSRSDLSQSDIDKAKNMVLTGRLVGGTSPDYLDLNDVDVQQTYTTFSTPTFSRSGSTARIYVQVAFPLTIFGFLGGNQPTIPFVVVEDFRFVGS
ncbi:MAG TPA: TadE/TadG family type IV pilus assembly protein [Hyphomonadaceae bacterium]|nr:TadE/TadG family type IV pilus assembly protein [Hyphomonadaceae bacterium]